jgi:hypothetical protein
MMPRGWALLLSAYLLGWVLLTLATEVLSVLPSIGRRGPIAVAELVAHGLSAVVCASAGRMLLIRAPSARVFSAAAIVLSALVSIQSLYWTMLPRNTAPSDRLPLAILVCCHAAFWLALIGWYARKRARD